MLTRYGQLHQISGRSKHNAVTDTFLIHVRAENYSLVRDPLNLTGQYPPVGNSPAGNSTGTDHRPPSPGMQCFTKHHEFFVHPGMPLAFLVAHNASGSRKITHAQFKLAIHPTEEGA